MLSFQDFISILNDYWSKYGCSILQPYTTEVGAGTLHPATIMGSITNTDIKIAYVQPSVRPADGRYGVNPNRLYQHHQYQVLLKPVPYNLQQLFLKSLEAIGINIKNNDIRFIEDDWENPSVGAWGLGWEIWCNGAEICQFTYMQQVGGLECDEIPGELAYGLERIVMFIQKVDSIYDIVFDNKGTKYGEIFKRREYEFSKLSFEMYKKEELINQFTKISELIEKLVNSNLPVVAYDQCLKLSHTLNCLDSMNVISASDRAAYILKIRSFVKKCCLLYKQIQ